MLPGQPQLEGSGPGRGNTDTTGRGLRGRCPRETAGATSRRGIQKCRGKRKILGKSHPESPWVSVCLSPACFLSDKTQRELVLPRLYLRFLRSYVSTHAHTHI